VNGVAQKGNLIQRHHWERKEKELETFANSKKKIEVVGKEGGREQKKFRKLGINNQLKEVWGSVFRGKASHRNLGRSKYESFTRRTEKKGKSTLPP